jgi:hypothetical protein
MKAKQTTARRSLQGPKGSWTVEYGERHHRATLSEAAWMHIAERLGLLVPSYIVVETDD